MKTFKEFIGKAKEIPFLSWKSSHGEMRGKKKENHVKIDGKNDSNKDYGEYTE